MQPEVPTGERRQPGHVLLTDWVTCALVQANGLIEDPGYLLAADPSRLLPVLHTAVTRDGHQAAEAARYAAPRLNQGSVQLRLAALQVGARALL